MKRLVLLSLFMIGSLFAQSCSHTIKSADGFSLEGFSFLFDGETLDGWRKLTEYSGNSGKWEAINGSIVGAQYPEGEGGLLVTEQKYSDYELYSEVKADYPIDSGLFLRVQPNVLSYQVTIDYRPEGEVGALYSPGGGGFLVHRPEGKNLWKANEFNSVRVRIKGQPPHIQAWINGSEVFDYIDKMIEEDHRVPEEGFIGIQVHPGPSWGEDNKVYFRKILIKELNQEKNSK